MVLSVSAFSLILLAAQASSTNGSRITGRVTDSISGVPLSGARVTLMSIVDVPGGVFGRRPRQSITDANGAFAFDGLEPGQYQLGVEKNGFASYPDVLVGGPPSRLTVAGNHEEPPLRIALKKAAVITGRIVDAAGEPQSDLEVSALRRTDQAGPLGFVPNGSGRTNDLGEFRISGLAAGEYKVVASVSPRGPFDAIQTGAVTTFAPTFFPGTLDQSAARVMTMSPGQTATVEFAIKAVTAYRVSGVAVDQTGRPSPRAMVTLIGDMRASGSFMPIMSVAADDGTFLIGDVVPGTYQIVGQANQGGGGGLNAISIDVAGPSEASRSGPATITVSAADVTGLKVVVDSR